MENIESEGIHFASLRASYQALLHDFYGIEIRDECLLVNPNLPSIWSEISFKMYYKGSLIAFKIDQYNAKIELIEKGSQDVIINIKDEVIKL